MKKIIFAVLIISLIFLVGCKQLIPDDSPDKLKALEELKNITEEEPIKETSKPEVEKEVEVAKPVLTCTHNSNCTGKEFCIEGQCGLIASLYKTSECTKKCNFGKVKITTSDEENYELSRGRGGYTAASALEWTIVSGPDYCQGEKIVVPFKILKRNYGKIFADEVIVLKVGETSKTIGHPLMPEIAFTLRVESVDETCS